MTDLILSKVACMSSLQIAEVVRSRHDKVKQSIERLAAQGVFKLPRTETTESVNGIGRTQTAKHYVFEGHEGKRNSMVVVAQMSPRLTAALVDRWMELENALAVQKPPMGDSENINDLARKAVDNPPEGFNAIAFQKAINSTHKMFSMLPGISNKDRYNALTLVVEKFLPGVSFTMPAPPAPPVFTPAEKAKTAPAVKTQPATPTSGETKVCNTCNTEKPVTEFRKDGDSYRGRCKPCHSAYEIARRAGK